MSTSSVQTPIVLGDLKAIVELSASGDSAGPQWWRNKKQAGLQNLQNEGFPSLRAEDWKYTDVTQLLGLRLGLPDTSPSAHGLTAQALIDANVTLPDAKIELVFVDGRFDANLSKGHNLLPDNAFVGSVAEAWKHCGEDLARHIGANRSEKETPFAHLNAALMSDGACIFVPKGCAPAETVHVIFLCAESEKQAHPRNLFVVDANAELSFVESWCSLQDGRTFTNPVTEVYLGDNAKCKHHVWQRLSDDTFLTSQTSVYQQRDSVYQHHGIWLGASLCRNDLRVYLRGSGAESRLDGLYVGRKSQHIDNHTYIHHEVPHCRSAELYKGILDDKSHGVFNGVVYVHPGASQSDAQQGNHNLLLSPEATIDTKPQLEIFNDDVKCAHGSTVGQLEPNSLFYLRSRGISQEQAERMLTNAFAGDVVEAIDSPLLKSRAYEIVNARLAELAHAQGEDQTA